MGAILVGAGLLVVLLVAIGFFTRGWPGASADFTVHQSLRDDFAGSFGPSCRAHARDAASDKGNNLTDAKLDAYCGCTLSKIQAALTDTDITTINQTLAAGNDLPQIYSDKLHVAAEACSATLQLMQR